MLREQTNPRDFQNYRARAPTMYQCTENEHVSSRATNAKNGWPVTQWLSPRPDCGYWVGCGHVPRTPILRERQREVTHRFFHSHSLSGDLEKHILLAAQCFAASSLAVTLSAGKGMENHTSVLS